MRSRYSWPRWRITTSRRPRKRLALDTGGDAALGSPPSRSFAGAPPGAVALMRSDLDMRGRSSSRQAALGAGFARGSHERTAARSQPPEATAARRDDQHALVAPLA